MKKASTTRTSFVISEQSVRLYSLRKMPSAIAKLEKQFGFNALSDNYVLSTPLKSPTYVSLHVRGATHTVYVDFFKNIRNIGTYDRRFWFWVDKKRGLWYPINLSVHERDSRRMIMEQPPCFRVTAEGQPKVDLERLLTSYVEEANIAAEMISETCFTNKKRGTWC